MDYPFVEDEIAESAMELESKILWMICSWIGFVQRILFLSFVQAFAEHLGRRIGILGSSSDTQSKVQSFACL